MSRIRAIYACPLVALVRSAHPQLRAAEVRDRARLFTPEAVARAETTLDRIERRTRIPAVIETIESVPGWVAMPPHQKKEGPWSSFRAAGSGNGL